MRCYSRLAKGATICPECGAPASSGVVSAGLPVERRLLTILFCDLVGSTELAVRLDPEDLHELLAIYQMRGTKIIEAAGGTVSRYLGDGILAYFGFPAANEDDAERAVTAGLKLIEHINDGNELAEKFTVRIGIATGIVVVGDLLNPAMSDRLAAVGETPNLAFRLQSLAKPGTVVIASSTQQLIGGLFECRPVQLRRVKGFAEPITAWQVLGKSELAYRFEALRSKRPIVGRDEERGQLIKLWQKASSGHGQVTIISGEAGIGKSRLALDFIQRIRPEYPVIRRYDCSPNHASSMLHPLLAQLRHAAHVDAADPVDTKFEKLEAHLANTGNRAREVTAVIGDLMALPVSERFKPPALDARQKLDFLFQALLKSLETIAQQRPMIILVEDVHWIDATTKELLDLLIARVRDWPVLVLMTVRKESGIVWSDEAHISPISLDAIDHQSAEIIVRSFDERNRLSDAEVQSIIGRADGIPLFLEELTRLALEGGATGMAEGRAPRPLADRSATIPAPLQSSLMSRLDRLGPARQVAMVAAALGRQFRLNQLQALLPDRSGQDLHNQLDQLVNAELITSTEMHPEPAYAFRHALIQDAAYSTLLRGDRRALHGQIAQVLRQQFPETVAMQPEIVASHFTKAGITEPAIDYWLMAGRRAASRSAIVEAVQHFSEGIRLADTLPPSPERTRRLIDLHIALGPAMMAMKGYAASEGRDVFLRSESLVSEAGNVAEHMDVLLGLFNIHYGRAEHAEALSMAERHMSLAQEHGMRLGRAHTLLGECHAVMGDFGKARSHFEQAIESLDREPESIDELGVFASQQVVALSLLAGVYFALGEPELARGTTLRSIELANASQHPMSIALALVTDRLTPIPGGLDPDIDRASQVVEFCKQHGLKNFEMWARFALGATILRRGDAREAAEIIRTAIDVADAMSSRLFRPVQLATLAGAHAKLGEMAAALGLIKQAIEVAECTGERQAIAALYRTHNELLCAIGKFGEGKQKLETALKIAQQQQLKPEVQRIEKSLGALTSMRG